MGELLEYVIGGGWGEELPGDDSVPVAIIRGADFPAVRHGDVSTLPLRYETPARVNTRALREGDIVLEISGGTKGRPTGRTVYVHNRLLNDARATLIPASFCRLLRPARDRVHPRYLYYWLQDMYAQGRTWAYQVQSTGLANFQMKLFLEREVVWIPSLDEQRRIARVLGTLEDLIDSNRRLQETLAHQRLATMARVVSSASDSTTFGEIADLIRVQVPPADVTPGTAYLGLEHFAENARGLLGIGATDGLDSTKWRFEPGDVLYGKLRPYFRKVVRPHFGGVCSTEVWVLRPKEGVSSEYLEWVVSTQEFTDFAVAGSTGTRMPRANWDHVRTFVVSKPGGRNFVRALAASRVMWEQYWALHDENQEVARTRDELLPVLLSGRLRVEEVAA